MYKLVALDMDGTLLNDDKQISAENKEAIAKARARGVTVVLASGRPIEGIVDKLQELNLTTENDYVVHYNGSIVQNVATGEIVREVILNGSDAKKIARRAKELNVYVHAFSTKLGLIAPQMNPYTDIEAKINNIPITQIDFEELEDSHPIIKVMMIAEPSLLSNASEHLPASMHDDYIIVQSSPYFLEFLNPGSNKGVGVAAVAEKLNISADEVICIGDAGNDHHMLQYAGLGIAMANAMPETKAIADYITASNNDSGVAKALDKFILSADTH